MPAVLSSRGPSFEIVELIAVASGCTDRTVEILRSAAERDPRIRVIVQPQRRGKVAATAAGIAAARGDVILLANSDTVPRRGAIEQLALPFADPLVDLVCAHPVPAIGPESMTARVGRILWELHDKVSAVSPKVGEAFAFRRSPIPLGPSVEDDDSFIGAYARSKGWGVRYARDAVVYNRVPSFPKEYLRQRLRINRHLLGVYKSTGISSSTWSPKLVVTAALEYCRE
ncbi:MAG: glycosyltransferase, partial [Thermoplasmata archaeon]|nr:glycosyltransferase [Thermoplasmata archaeon]